MELEIMNCIVQDLQNLRDILFGTQKHLSMLVLLQERGHQALSSWAPRQTSYL